MDARTRAYYLHRIVQEQEAARTAKCAQARARHEELAESYRLRCRIDAPQEESSETRYLEFHYAD